jgi:chemotaxis protein CheX
MATSASPNDAFPRVLLTAVVQAIPTAFKPLCGDGEVASRLGVPEPADVWIAAGIPFKGSPPWDLTLLLPAATAPALAQAFVGFEIPLDSPDMNDAVGELVNVLAGHVIERLDAAGHKTAMTLPVVERGDQFVLHPPGFASEIFLNCQSPPGPFWLRLAIKSESAA